MNYDKEFISTFNEYYPFERYILKTPVKLNYLFDDIKLTEIFIPGTEIKPIVDDNGKYLFSTDVNSEEIYVKVVGQSGEMRLAYFDFAEHIREEIQNAVYRDFGLFEWECLYVEIENDNGEDLKYLKEALDVQKELICNKYGECKIKPNFQITSTIDILNV